MLGTTLNPKQFLDRVAHELGRIEPKEIQKLADLIAERYDAGRFVFVIGHGGSGNSPNILRAVDWANTHGLTTFGCTGFSGGKLREMAHHTLHVPLDDMGIVESIHLTAFHWVVDDTYRRISL